MSRGANWQFDIFEPRDKKVNCNRVFLASFRLENIFHLKNQKNEARSYFETETRQKTCQRKVTKGVFSKIQRNFIVGEMLKNEKKTIFLMKF